MNSLLTKAEEKITLSIHMVNGETFVNRFPVDDCEVVEVFLAWYRSPRWTKVFTFHKVYDAEIYSIHHRNIALVRVEGYIEPDGRGSRWYERLIDRFRLWRMTR
ncbi:hypothetical protein C5G87_06970 [Paenibacillus peoriae]|uniref:hypothetical protein n=1 Tax=Paenibacillus peoriae TaxID=59893 RepID=UPI000CECB010|nr:hypothetical protein [Paenibacillus peoriae]PPQ49110.1 hypothetical protein C5G87_06970 [Paenibacillus peoriae]